METEEAFLEEELLNVEVEIQSVQGAYYAHHSFLFFSSEALFFFFFPVSFCCILLCYFGLIIEVPSFHLKPNSPTIMINQKE